MLALHPYKATPPKDIVTKDFTYDGRRWVKKSEQIYSKGQLLWRGLIKDTPYARPVEMYLYLSRLHLEVEEINARALTPAQVEAIKSQVRPLIIPFIGNMPDASTGRLDGTVIAALEVEVEPLSSSTQQIGSEDPDTCWLVFAALLLARRNALLVEDKSNATGIVGRDAWVLSRFYAMREVEARGTKRIEIYPFDPNAGQHDVFLTCNRETNKAETNTELSMYDGESWFEDYGIALELGSSLKSLFSSDNGKHDQWLLRSNKSLNENITKIGFRFALAINAAPIRFVWDVRVNEKLDNNWSAAFKESTLNLLIPLTTSNKPSDSLSYAKANYNKNENKTPDYLRFIAEQSKDNRTAAILHLNIDLAKFGIDMETAKKSQIDCTGSVLTQLTPMARGQPTKQDYVGRLLAAYLTRLGPRNDLYPSDDLTVKFESLTTLYNEATLDLEKRKKAEKK